MTLDPRTAVLVGAGQFVQKPADPADAVEPLQMMVEAIERAADDAGSRALLGKVNSIRVVKGAWSYRDPGTLIAQRIGASPSQSVVTPDGGNTPQTLVNDAALAIERGELDVVVLVGAEGIYTRRRARRAGARIPYTNDDAAPPAPMLGKDMPMSSEIEMARGFEAPINIYPMFETAIRHANGETPEAHLRRISELWERFNRVAVDNPYAWIRRPMTAEQIRTASPDNRMIGYPYTKAMNSNWDLDQAAAVILCSVATAQSLGISRDRFVFPHAGTDAHDTYLVSERDTYHASPAIRVAAARCFELAGRSVADVDHVDVYSCFPSAVQISAKEIGLSLDRQLTVTGGLPFAGGPLNNYVMHSIATMAGVLRADPGSLGLITANGGYVTKHAIGLYSTEPPSGGFRHADVQAEVDRFPTRTFAPDHTGAATVEAYTVMHDAEGPAQALVSCLTADGRRTFTNTRDRAAMDALVAADLVGSPVEVDRDAVVHLG